MTLLEEMEQRRRRQARGAGTGAARRESSQVRPDSPSDGPSEADLKTGYAVLLSISMFVVHATLAALARIQYGQETGVFLVCKEALPSLPIFAALVYYLHPMKALALRLVAAALSVALGCWLVYMVNEEGYYASMHRAPALGTLWVWLFIELEWYYGAASLAAVTAYLKYNSYSFVY